MDSLLNNAGIVSEILKLTKLQEKYTTVNIMFLISMGWMRLLKSRERTVKFNTSPQSVSVLNLMHLVPDFLWSGRSKRFFRNS